MIAQHRSLFSAWTTNVPDRGRGNFCASSRVLTPAQPRAEIESPRVRVPYTARCELPAATPLRTTAHIHYPRRYRSASGHRPHRPADRLWYVIDQDSDTPSTGRAFGRESRLTVTLIAVTTGRCGILHSWLNREACRWVSRPHPPSTPHLCLSFHFVLAVVDDTLNRLNPRAMSGEMTTPSGTGACDMRSTGTESDSVFAHAAPHFGPCTEKTPDDDEPRRTDWGYFTIAVGTSPAPASVAPARSGHPPVSHSLTRPSPTVEHRKSHGGTRHHTRPIDRYLTLTPTTTRTNAPSLTRCPLRFPARISPSATWPARRTSR